MSLSHDTLKALHEAATPGDLSAAEEHTASETVECPCCQGDGEVEAADYCNFDGVALGVQFYGIGQEFGAHEALWKYLRNAVPEILTLIAERDAMRAALEWYADQMCEGLCLGKDPKSCAVIGSDNCAGCPAVVALGGNHHGS